MHMVALAVSLSVLLGTVATTIRTPHPQTSGGRVWNSACADCHRGGGWRRCCRRRFRQTGDGASAGPTDSSGVLQPLRPIVASRLTAGTPLTLTLWPLGTPTGRVYSGPTLLTLMRWPLDTPVGRDALEDPMLEDLATSIAASWIVTCPPLGAAGCSSSDRSAGS